MFTVYTTVQQPHICKTESIRRYVFLLFSILFEKSGMQEREMLNFGVEKSLRLSCIRPQQDVIYLKDDDTTGLERERRLIWLKGG